MCKALSTLRLLLTEALGQAQELKMAKENDMVAMQMYCEKRPSRLLTDQMRCSHNINMRRLPFANYMCDTG